MEWLLASIDLARPHDLAPALRWHGRSMALAWGILAPLAVMVARYGKVWPGQDWPRVLDNPIWWRCHWMALSLVLCLSLLGLSLVLGAPGRGGVHAVLGYALLGLMALQVGLGLLRGSKGGPTAPTLRGDHYDMTPRRVAFEWCHKIGGYIAVVLAMIVILLGLWQANAPHWMWLAVGLWWPALTAVAIVLQRRGMAIDTYQAIWGPDPAHPGNRRRPIGWGIRRPHERKCSMYGEIEGTGFEVIDPDFEACFIGHARVERLWSGARWSEGPVWFAAGRYLLWSDIPNNRILRWDETDGSVSTFRQPSNNANGHTVDRHGRLVSCEHLTRRVTRTEHDGIITVIADRFEGKRLNSPNDVVVKSDGSVWFTDPSYGILMDYEGERAESEIGACHVYRADPDGKITAVATDYLKPNGLAFSPDESLLYIADTGATHHENGPKHIRRHAVNPDGTLSGGEVFAECTNGLFDGFRLDRDGRIWTSAADGVHCYAPDGRLIGKVRIPELVANVCFGGPKLNRLFICGTTSLYVVYLNVNGISPV